MKIAILGSGVIALEAAIDLLSEGASVKLIGTGEPGGHLGHLSEVFPEHTINFEDSSSEVGRRISGCSLTGEVPLKSFLQKYCDSLLGFLISKGAYQKRRVLRVQKQFLEMDEEIVGHSRLFDLFRVTTALNPSGMVEEQLAQNPELKERVGEEILSSLKSGVESFEDFDIVIDARGTFQSPLFLGPGGGLALNENTLSDKSHICYGRLETKSLELLEDAKIVTIVGSSYTSALNLIQLENWLEQDRDRVINIVTSEKVAFRKLLKNESIDLRIKERIKRIIHAQMDQWRTECERVEKEILNWRGLDSHERIKVQPPEFPTPKIGLYEGYTVTSVDRLLDQESTFLTLEIPQWRNDNESKELVTLAQDLVVCSKGFQEEVILGPMRSDEPGYFSVRERDIASGLKSIKLVKSRLFEFFSRADNA